MAERNCNFCNKDHTEVKCPNLDGYATHMVSIVKARTGKDYDLSDRKTLYSLGRAFIGSASPTETLGMSRYKWHEVTHCYGKKLSYKAAGLKRRGQKRTRATRCGYCRTPSHTRRTCPDMKRDVAFIKKVTKRYRTDFIEVCSEIGLGLGSLVKLSINDYGNQYREYWGEYPDTAMGVVTYLPINEMTPFANLNRWDELCINPNIKIKLVGPKGALTERNSIDYIIHHEIFESSFNHLVPNARRYGISQQYDIEVVGKSVNLSYNPSNFSIHLDFLKRYDDQKIAPYIGGFSSWILNQTK
tara:strand:+ start:822 stop:1721 length:900 start_codon:yes stop_codon:yes gene_type:complete